MKIVIYQKEIIYFDLRFKYIKKKKLYKCCIGIEHPQINFEHHNPNKLNPLIPKIKSPNNNKKLTQTTTTMTK